MNKIITTVFATLLMVGCFCPTAIAGADDQKHMDNIMKEADKIQAYNDKQAQKEYNENWNKEHGIDKPGPTVGIDGSGNPAVKYTWPTGTK